MSIGIFYLSETIGQDEQKNLLPENGFQLFLKRAPNINFWVQKANLPGVELGVVESPNPFLAIPVPGDHIKFEDFDIIFRVSENLENYLEIYNWMIGLGKPNEFKQYADLKNNPLPSESIYSDISLLITNSKRNINIQVDLIDAFPQAISGLQFNVTEQDVQYLYANARFSYSYPKITIL